MNKFGFNIPSKSSVNKTDIINKGDYSIISINKNDINYEVLIDNEDADIVNKCRWYIGSDGYVHSTIPSNNKKIVMHRLVLNVLNTEQDKVVDHINFNKLDNRKSNLRLITHNENLHHRKVNNDSGYKGVYWREKYNKFEAVISIKGKQYYVGMHNTAEEAYNAIKNKLKELNLPDNLY